MWSEKPWDHTCDSGGHKAYRMGRMWWTWASKIQMGSQGGGIHTGWQVGSGTAASPFVKPFRPKKSEGSRLSWAVLLIGLSFQTNSEIWSLICRLSRFWCKYITVIHLYKKPRQYRRHTFPSCQRVWLTECTFLIKECLGSICYIRERWPSINSVPQTWGTSHLLTWRRIPYCVDALDLNVGP